jgi:hypothetical protein
MKAASDLNSDKAQKLVDANKALMHEGFEAYAVLRYESNVVEGNEVKPASITEYIFRKEL